MPDVSTFTFAYGSRTAPPRSAAARSLLVRSAALASRGAAELSMTTLLRLLTAGALTLTLLAAGVTLAAARGGGLYWLPAAFVLASTVAAVNAWVLLVEILR